MKITENQTINNRYRIVKELGQGGFAEVWLAEDLELDNRKVALKFFASERGLDSGGIELFKKEFIRTSELRHPNLLNSNHFGVVEHERIPFLEMPYCAGGSLASKVQAGHEFSEREIASILKDVGNGLSYLHEQGVIHRDIKPDNILISEGGRYLISDFGISLRLRSTLTKATQRKGGSSSGTTAFMAPELFRNQPDGSEKTDIFGLGVSIFELCTGILPWQGIGGLALFQGAGAPALQGQYSEQFEKLFQRCLEVDPQLRPTAKELEHAAEHFLKEGTWTAKAPEPKPEPKPQPKKVEDTGRRTEPLTNVEDKKEPKVVVPPKPPVPGQTVVNKEVKKKQSVPIAIFAGVTILIVAVIFIAIFYTSSSEDAYADQLVTLDTTALQAQDTTSSESAALQQEASTAVQPVSHEATHTPTQPVNQEETEEQKEAKRRLANERAKNQKLESALTEGLDAYRSKDYDKAFPLMKYVADQGDDRAYFYLAYMYRNGLGTPVDLSESLRIYTLCANAGEAGCQNNLGVMYDNGTGVAENNYEAVKLYRKAAEQGYKHAQNNLGLSYENGEGVAKDYYEAVKWYRKAAELGLASAQYNLGKMYYSGNGVTRDYSEAVKWNRKAADQGYVSAQDNLGDMYNYGNGVTRDYSEAVNWYRKAAEQGYASAQNNLADMYYYGNGVTKDYTEAVKWYRKAAEQGYSSAQDNLAFMYSEGNGVAQDYTEAVKWYRKAAEQGSAYAQNGLGNMYYNGNGVTQDNYEAAKWYHKAAEQGHASAQGRLGYMYEFGKGVAKDLDEAKAWYTKASNQGNAKAKEALQRLDNSDRIITGRVTEAKDGYGVPGTNVFLKGTTRGTVTDADGYYQLTVPATGGALVFSFIGFKTVEKAISSDKTNNRIDVSFRPGR